jgi:23S rRNA pseudouridine1911/1915/1917 synthase
MGASIGPCTMSTFEERRAPLPSDLSRQTLAAVLRWLYSDCALSWNQARAWINNGKVKIDGEWVFDDTRRVEAGQLLEVFPAATRRSVAPIAAQQLIYADEDIVVVSKPAGLECSPAATREKSSKTAAPRGRNRAKSPRPAPTKPPLAEAATLSDRVASALRGRKEPDHPILAVIARLDESTSGLVLFARHHKARIALEAQAKEPTFEHQIMALVHGVAQSGQSRSHLVANRGDGLRGSWQPHFGPLPHHASLAETHFNVVERFAGGFSLVSCRTLTQRMHQVRIHLADARNPVVGETLYRATQTATSDEIERSQMDVREAGDRREIDERAGRPLIHAHSLGFVHPTTGKRIRFEDPYPEDFAAVLAQLRTRANSARGPARSHSR